jgi:hypothetical protein
MDRQRYQPRSIGEWVADAFAIIIVGGVVVGVLYEGFLHLT